MGYLIVQCPASVEICQLQKGRAIVRFPTVAQRWSQCANMDLFVAAQKDGEVDSDWTGQMRSPEKRA